MTRQKTNEYAREQRTEHSDDDERHHNRQNDCIQKQWRTRSHAEFLPHYVPGGCELHSDCTFLLSMPNPTTKATAVQASTMPRLGKASAQPSPYDVVPVMASTNP